nr:MAG TPA: Lysozyme [Caudoviricetes sp.]
MPVKDDSLIAQYIRAIENPDSVGFNKGRWEAPPKGKSFDINSRGFGMDVNYNDATRALTAHRKGKWLTEEEERQLRQDYTDYIEDVLEDWTPKMLREIPSEEKKAMALGMMYRGDNVKKIINNPSLRNAYYFGSNENMQKAVSNYYQKNKQAPRAENHNKFFNSRRQSTYNPSRFETPKFVPKHKFYDDGGYLDDTWDSLSLADKAEMIKVAVANGITTLPEIRSAYNEFAKGGYIPSDSIKKRISNWEGSSMKTNRSFEAEAKDFNRVIPEEIRSKLSPKQLDALYSYGYNVGMGNLKERVVPTLTAYTKGKASKEDVQRSMWAKRDNELKGLTTRRNTEREMFGGNYRTTFTGTGKLGTHIDPSEYTYYEDLSPMIDNINIPQMQFPDSMAAAPTTLYKAPTIDETLFSKPEAIPEESLYSPQQERIEGLKRMNTIMGLLGQSTPFAGLTDPSTPGLLSYVNQIYNL